MNKKVHIISHSHWDREWYMAYEQHHMRLVELMDDLLALIENNPAFDSFHLDGQTIILDDYLQVRPEKKEAVQAAITSGKLRIGPFYILQDDFLISSESNTRNMLVGMKESKKWGAPTLLGYFPDTFGNMGQTPQMMKLANLQVAAFGRGVKPIGFDNEVLTDDNFTSQYSEMYWKGPDGSQILGILFANWYSNGNEIPTTDEEALSFWDAKLADVEKYASTRHLLLMNGVDHQPIQKDITKAIDLANELYPEYEFVHSNFTDYLAAVESELTEQVGTVEGELTSQETDGWFTLANTASTRVYLKQWNTRVSRQLENIAEPLASMAYEVTGSYPHDQLDYAWKLLMQNHPHDSICGCSLDEVHREMLTRFEKAYEVGKYIADEALKELTSSFDTTAFSNDSKPFVIVNTAGIAKSSIVELDIELERILFQEMYPSDGYEKLSAESAQAYHIVDNEGNPVPAIISSEQVRFGYDLPKDAFRVPFMQKFVTVTLEVDQLGEFSWRTFALVQGEARLVDKALLVKEGGRILENEQIKVTIMENGSLTILDKQLGKQLDDLLVFEDVGDIANEYIFRQPSDDRAILSNDFPHKVEVLENNGLIGKVRLTHFMEIPAAAEALLDKEQRSVVDFRYRKAQRSQQLISYPISTVITINRLSNIVDFETTVDNQAKDHRLRVLFPTQVRSETHEADSIYEVVKRSNKPSIHWQNPTNPQHQHAFVNMHEDNYGVTISNFGLNEYEIIEDTIAVTLLRCVGELGDWGYFATPEAQCLGKHRFNYAIVLHGEPETRFDSYQQAQAKQFDFVTQQVAIQAGTQSHTEQFLKVEAIGFPMLEKGLHPVTKRNSMNFAVTALKRGAENELILRGYNMADTLSSLKVMKTRKAEKQMVTLLNLLEEPLTDLSAISFGIIDNKKSNGITVDEQVEYTRPLEPYEIRTMRIDYEE